MRLAGVVTFDGDNGASTVSIGKLTLKTIIRYGDRIEVELYINPNDIRDGFITLGFTKSEWASVCRETIKFNILDLFRHEEGDE